MISADPNISEKKQVVNLWDAHTGKCIQVLAGSKNPIYAVKFAPHGKLLASGGEDGIRFWDVTTGKELHHILKEVRFLTLAFSPDGKSFAGAGEDGLLHLCDVATGREVRAWPSGNSGRTQVCFSPDGKSIAAGGELTHIWSVETGKEIASFASQGASLCLAFSPNGRVLASGGITKGDNPDQFVGSVEWWEISSGQQIRKIANSQGMVRTIAFAPDGRTLASGGQDSTILLWDVTGRANMKPVALNAATLDKLWTDLAADAPKADRALWTLALSPQQSLPFLKERLRPATVADGKQVAKLIVELESGNLNVRQKAERALVELGEAAEAALRSNCKKHADRGASSPD